MSEAERILLDEFEEFVTRVRARLGGEPSARVVPPRPIKTRKVHREKGAKPLTAEEREQRANRPRTLDPARVESHLSARRLSKRSA
jgi:hypothetical protein